MTIESRGQSRHEDRRKFEDDIRGGDEMGSLCSLTTGDEVFGIDTKRIREVLGQYTMCKIPLAPWYIAGIISNRGEVLTTVDLRALLGLGKRDGASVVLVLEDESEDGRYGLMVDAVGGVSMVNATTLEANPSTLGMRSKALFDGAYKLQTGLMVRLDTVKLHPSRLRDAGLFEDAAMNRFEGRKNREGQACEF